MGWFEDNISEPVHRTISGNDPNSIVGSPFAVLNHPFGADTANTLGHGLSGGLWTGASDIFKGPGRNDPAAPPAPPTLGQANLISMGNILSHEQRQAAASTTLTGGAGLLDEPTTASQVLLGS